MKRRYVLALIAGATSPLLAQNQPKPPTSGPITGEQVAGLLPKLPKGDLGYIARGWKSRDEAQRRFAEVEATANAEDSKRAARILTEAAAQDIRTLSRKETLRCLIALHAQPSLPYPDRITPAVLKRSDKWSKEYTATEYKWRTFAQRTLDPSLDLLPALDRLANAAPKDWRIQIVRASLLYRNKRGAQALEVARKLAAAYPEHLGTQVALAWYLRNVAVDRTDQAMLNEATRVLDRASKLQGTPADKRAYQAERDRNDFRRRHGLRS